MRVAQPVLNNSFFFKRNLTRCNGLIKNHWKIRECVQFDFGLFKSVLGFGKSICNDDQAVLDNPSLFAQGFDH